MNLSTIGWAIDQSLKRPAPKQLLEICDQWYSPYYNLFYILSSGICHEKYKTVAVELGVDQGRGSAAFALSGLCQVYGIDHTYKVGLNRLDDFDNFDFVKSDTLPVPEQLKNVKISLLHIDTEHSYPMAKAEFEAYKPLLTNPAIVFFDDLHAQDDDVLKYFMELPYPKIQDDRLHPENGFGVMLYVD